MIDANNRIYDNTEYSGFLNTNFFNVGIYLRLSRDDEGSTISESIINQRDFLIKYVKNQPNWVLTDIYQDDGYTGTNFNRPDFIRLKQDIEAGKINLVITKDLSRLGRDYIDTGYYIEKYFPSQKVRYIAVNDGIDTFERNNGNNDMSPFKSVVNDMYAKDISKKVRTSLRTKAEKGDFIGAFAAYGYKKSEKDKTKLVIDEEVADIVRYIFREYVNGNGLTYIASRLNEQHILCPSVYKRKTSNFHCKTKSGLWGHDTIRKILTNRVYIGELIQRKGEVISYKVKKYVALPESEHIIIKDAHDPIIDEETFNLAQDILKLKAHKDSHIQTHFHLLSGLLYCPRCNGRYKYQRQSGLKDDMVAVCGTYARHGKEYCSRGAIKESVLDRAVKDDLIRIAKEKLDTDKIMNLKDFSYQKQAKIKRDKQKVEWERRILDIDRIIKQAYEDKVLGVIDKDEFNNLVSGYREEKELLNRNLEELKNESKENKKEDKIKEIIKSIIDFENIDKNTIMSLISKIEIMDSENIKIYYRFSE